MENPASWGAATDHFPLENKTESWDILDLTLISQYTKGNSGFCRSSTEIRMFAHISVEVLWKSVEVFKKNLVLEL